MSIVYLVTPLTVVAVKSPNDKVVLDPITVLLSLLEDISQKILEKEVIEGDELKEMLSHSVMPEKVLN